MNCCMILYVVADESFTVLILLIKNSNLKRVTSAFAVHGRSRRRTIGLNVDRANYFYEV